MEIIIAPATGLRLTANPEQLAPAGIEMTPTASTEIAGPKAADLMAPRYPRPRPEHRMRAAECPKLDGDELSLLGRPDQLQGQPQRNRISGDDRLLKTIRVLTRDTIDVSFHGDRHLPGHPVLFLHHHSGEQGAREIRHQGAGHHRQSRLRAGVSGADEHAGMAADIPALAVAVRDLYQRRFGGRARPDLDPRPHPLS